LRDATTDERPTLEDERPVLEPLGLTETEGAVYLSLLKGRGSSVDELVREVGAAPQRNARVPPPPGSRTSAS
jgi:hypothetical protein